MPNALEDQGLGSLSQSARAEGLKSARTILYVIGVLTLLANIVFMFLTRSMVEAELKKEISALQNQGMEIDNAKVEEIKEGAIRAGMLINGGGVLLGIVFLVLGANVYNYPVATTTTGMVLYLGGLAVFGYIDPTSLARGWIVRVFILIGLFKAIQTAIAYEKENRDASGISGLSVAQVD